MQPIDVIEAGQQLEARGYEQDVHGGREAQGAPASVPPPRHEVNAEQVGGAESGLQTSRGRWRNTASGDSIPGSVFRGDVFCVTKFVFVVKGGRGTTSSELGNPLPRPSPQLLSCQHFKLWKEKMCSLASVRVVKANLIRNRPL